MNVGFTGTRHGLTALQRAALHRLLADLRPAEVHHGCCVGADEECARAAANLGNGCQVHAHPCTLTAYQFAGWALISGHRHPVKPPLERNRDIVDATDLLIACPDGHEEKQRSGTWHTVRFARRSGKPRVLIFPDGSLEREDAK
jgi:hypothetical protein